MCELPLGRQMHPLNLGNGIPWTLLPPLAHGSQAGTAVGLKGHLLQCELTQRHRTGLVMNRLFPSLWSNAPSCLLSLKPTPNLSTLERVGVVDGSVPPLKWGL